MTKRSEISTFLPAETKDPVISPPNSTPVILNLSAVHGQTNYPSLMTSIRYFDYPSETYSIILPNKTTHVSSINIEDRVSKQLSERMITRENGPKRTPNGGKFTKRGQKRTKTNQNGRKQTQKDENERKLTKTDKNEQKNTYQNALF